MSADTETARAEPSQRVTVVHWGCTDYMPVKTLCGATTTPDRDVGPNGPWPDCVVCESLAAIPGYCPNGGPCSCVP